MLKISRKVLHPKIDFFIQKIISRNNINFCKLNFGFWNTLYQVEKNKILPNFNSIIEPDGWLNLYGHEFLDEIKKIINLLPQENITFAASDASAPQVTHYEAAIVNLNDFIFSHFPNDFPIIKGWIMKDYAQKNELEYLVEIIAKNHDVLVVGLEHTNQLSSKFNFRKFEHLEISFEAGKQRHEIKEKIKTMIKKMNDPCVIYQAGESLSLWFTYELLKENCKHNSFDFGRCLDKWCKVDKFYEILPDIKDQPWQKFILLKS